MEAPPSPDYIPGPEAPPLPDYIPGPEAPPSPDYMPGPEYPEYLPPADDVLPAEDHPIPAAVSPTAESPGYITESEPEMEPEEEDGDDEKSEEDSIEYLTSGGDDDADDDGDDLSKDDVDDEEEEESSDSEEEEEEHLAPTVPAPALHSSIPAFEDSDETEPFEKGETAATPPPFRYHVADRITVQPHILMPFRSESKVERLLAIPTPPLSPVLPTSYLLPPFLMPLPIFTPLPTSSFPSSLPSTSGSESIPKADILLRKRARFTTPTGGYEVGESFVAAAARQIRPALTIADRRRADDRLIGRVRRERRYFRTLSTTYAQEVAHSRDYCTQIMYYCHSREKMAPKRTTRATQVLPVIPAPTATTTTITEAQLQALIKQGVAATMVEAEASRVRNGYDRNGLGPRLAQAVRKCTYLDFLKCQPLNFKGTEGVIGLTQWSRSYMVELHVKTVTLEVAQALPWKTLKKMMTDKVEKYIGGLPNMIHDSVKGGNDNAQARVYVVGNRGANPNNVVADLLPVELGSFDVTVGMDWLSKYDAKMAPKRTTRSTQVPPVTPAPTATTTTVTEAQLQALINHGVAAAMAEAEASRVRNGYVSNGSGPRLAQTVRECTYPDFLKCQPLNFKGTEGVIGLTQWFKKMESVFNISNYTAACQVKYVVCTLQGVALAWWNSHVKTVALEVAQALPWKNLKKMMTDKYCPRGEIKKIETEMWELKTKGVDVIGYSRRFQELALMCDRTFPEESDRVDKYIGGVPDTIHDSVKATKPKTMQEAIKFATELMDKRIRDAVENK
nr:hypothetical protein [Tanacetum cinerariifolium]